MRVTIVVTHIKGLRTLLITTHEPPSNPKEALHDGQTPDTPKLCSLKPRTVRPKAPSPRQLRIFRKEIRVPGKSQMQNPNRNPLKNPLPKPCSIIESIYNPCIRNLATG